MYLIGSYAMNINVLFIRKFNFYPNFNIISHNFYFNVIFNLNWNDIKIAFKIRSIRIKVSAKKPAFDGVNTKH